jgi:hypothetical protein
VQEALPIRQEFRVHSLEDIVLPTMTFERYGPCAAPEERDEVNAFIAGLLARLPDALVGESLYAWDVARTTDGAWRVVETNLVGYHPVYERGFQASGFFQYHPMGPPLLADLVRHVRRSYHVGLDVNVHWKNEPNKHGLFLRIFRHYLDRDREPRRVWPAGPSDPSPPARLDAVLSATRREAPRFALLLETARQVGAEFGTFWVAAPDADVEAVAAAADGDCVIVPESELVPEAAGRPDVPAGLTRQVARVALVARTAGDFCFELSPDVVCTRPFRAAELVRRGKARCYRYINQVHADRYEAAVEVLGLPRSGWVHGSVPQVVARLAVAALTEYLASLEPGGGASAWRGRLLRRRGWSFSALYHVFLDAFALDDVYHFAGDESLDENCVWSAEDWDGWDPWPSLSPRSDAFFSVLQLGAEVPAEAVRRRLAPLFGEPMVRATTPWD